MIKILQEVKSDENEIDFLLDLTFGSGRHALSSYKYRVGVSSITELCFILRDDFDILIGVIRFWPISIGSERLSGLLLGPIGIHPTRQGEGLGEALIRKGIKKADETGWSRILLIGEESYYGRFGFSKNLVKNIYLNNDISNKRLLGTELKHGSLLNVKGPLFKCSE